ncbi:MAG: 3-isopropylmalate dehydratase small subunit [Oscillospiraceae bacterium]|jgi:3-isopropylmalate/(R)-2-methylmalate dehydratase small subunit|nr:3-isopropylmalate dehydratase small subunit [Oscillospiraceae bacterium]
MNKVIKYGDNVDTDVIIPARYLNTTNKQELTSHAMEDIDPDFHKKITAGDIIVAGKNFGCGSSREHAPIVIKESGIALIIAESFARIFYRNSINIGLAIIESPEAAKEINEGDELSVDFENGLITNKSQNGKEYKVAPFPEFLQGIINGGGLVAVAASGELH